MNRSRRTLLAAILTAAARLAGSGQSTPATNGQPASISGTVYEAGFSTPLAKVEVMLFRSGARARATRTDGEGRFAFHDVEPGAHRLTADKNGYVYQTFPRGGQPSRRESFELQPAQEFTGADFHLERAPVVTGRILDQDGNPLPQAYVHLMVRTYAMEHRQASPRGHAQTNDLGEYRIHDAVPGEYLIAIDYADRLLNDSGVRYEGAEAGDYDRTFYPGVRDPDEAMPVQLRAGEVRAIDLQLRRVPTVRVSGTVRLAGGAPLPDRINLEFYPAWDITGRLRRKFVSPDIPSGTFEFPRVPRGPHVLRALENVDGEQVFLHQQLEVGDADIDDLELTLDTGATIRGRVSVVGQSSGEFSFRKWPLIMSIFSIPHNPGNTSGLVDESGSALIDNVVPATYNVGVSNLPPDAYLKTVRLAERELPGRKLTLQSGETLEGLEAVVDLDGGRIDGVVLNKDRQTVSTATVVAVPLAASPDRFLYLRISETDQQGRFAVRGLAPGRYRLLAFDDDTVAPAVYRDLEFLDNQRGNSEVVGIDKDSRLILELNIAT